MPDTEIEIERRAKRAAKRQATQAKLAAEFPRERYARHEKTFPTYVEQAMTYGKRLAQAERRKVNRQQRASRQANR